MKKRYIVMLSVLAAIILFIVIAYMQSTASFNEMLNTPITEIDPSSLEDGVYEGSYTSFPVSVEVEVTITSGVITSIEIIKHDNGRGSSAEVIVESVIDFQSVEVDAIAGATHSSLVILFAISDALNTD